MAQLHVLSRIHMLMHSHLVHSFLSQNIAKREGTSHTFSPTQNPVYQIILLIQNPVCHSSFPRHRTHCIGSFLDFKSRCSTPVCRPNTYPQFITFTPSSGYNVPSTLKPERWQALLKHYPDPQFSNIVAGIAKYGARVGYEGPFIRVQGRNHPSVLRIPSEISQSIAAEVSTARVRDKTKQPSSFLLHQSPGKGSKENI